MTPRRVLVLQMCRMGDLLQTTPMLRGIRRRLPDADVTLVVVDRFAATPVPSRLYDHLVVFPHEDLWTGLRDGGGDWEREFARLNGFLAELGQEPFDVGINLTHTDLSSLMMAILPIRDRRGAVIKPDRQRAVLGGWSQYFWANARSRALGCFNLVDLFRWTSGVACDDGGLEMSIGPAAGASVGRWLDEHRLAGRPLIAVQLGASEEGKRWPAERFAAMAAHLPRDSGEIVVVGTRSERPLAERFIAATTRHVHDAVGTTSLEELGALLRGCRLLITNDTGTMHVAAAVGTRVLDLSTGPVFVHETGPYGLEHVVVEPDIDCFPCAAGSQCHHYGCRDRLTPDEAAGVARHAMGEGPLPALSAGVRVLAPRRTTSGRLEYWPARASQVTRNDVIRRLSAIVWEESLDVTALERETASNRLATGDEVPFDSPAFDWQPLLGSLDDLSATASRAAAIARRLASARGARQSEFADRAHRHLEQLLRLSETERACHPIVGFLLVEIDSVLPTDLSSVARAHAKAYAGAAARAERLAQLIRHLPCNGAADARKAS
jgi:ADP-heptose:LPS heptosyltransferase